MHVVVMPCPPCACTSCLQDQGREEVELQNPGKAADLLNLRNHCCNFFSTEDVNRSGSFIKSSCRKKKCYYQKCTVPAATAEDPPGCESVQDAYMWPRLYLNRIADKFGKHWLCRRLSAWRWEFNSAFSGVGAPESVTGLAQ